MSERLMKKPAALLLIPALLALGACQGDNTPAPVAATTAQASQQTATANVNGKTYILSATPTRSLQPGVARQYDIERRDDTTMILVSVTDTNGDATALDAAKITVSAGVVPDAPTEISLKPIQVEGFTNLVGVIRAKPPAKLQLRMEIQSGGSRTTQSFTQDVLPR
jgi:hypothetical protein